MLFDMVLKLTNLDAATRAKIQPLIALRQEIGRIDTELEGLEADTLEHVHLENFVLFPRLAALRRT